ncbi:histidine phosphatase family protein [Angustibacter luteus]|uniref:phosphoglycerate mutase (2,3-diphosphoglycerate-dependent) n=1 Tax=Angustibacter luteus TaxID=658456 RepID=A0ABW1JD40_9ACTN
MTVAVVFETHATTVDNERGAATGWLPGELSGAGREQAAELGRRRLGDGIDAVFTSDLARAVQTTELAFAGRLPVLQDWRLRECDYGDWNGAGRDVVLADRLVHLDLPYPGGESWRQATARVAGLLADLPTRWSGRRVLVVGHVATRYGLEVALRGRSLEQLLSTEFGWQPGWEYEVG